MHSKLFETALGISNPWFVNGIDFNAAAKQLKVNIDFVAGSHFPHPEMRRRPSRTRYRCQALPALEPASSTTAFSRCARLASSCLTAAWRSSSSSGPAKLKGFTLLFEAMVLMLAQQISFTAVARTVGESWHLVNAICKCYVELALAEIDLSNMTSIAVDETSYQCGHHYLTLVAVRSNTKSYHD